MSKAVEYTPANIGEFLAEIRGLGYQYEGSFGTYRDETGDHYGVYYRGPEEDVTIEYVARVERGQRTGEILIRVVRRAAPMWLFPWVA